MGQKIVLKGVSFSRDRGPILDNINLQIARGEMIGLIGPNGAGKSTLLKLLVKILKADSGEIQFEGEAFSTWDQKALAQKIAYLPQNPTFEAGFTVFEIVLMGRYARLSRFQRISRKDEATAEAAMKKTETLPFSDRLFTALSGGEQQRVLLARALTQEASVLLLDEPTASLDLYHQLSFFQLLTSLVKEGKTVLFAIHDLNLAARFCERLILLHQGQVVADGFPQAVLTPIHLQSVYGISAEISHNPTINRLSVLPLSIDDSLYSNPKSSSQHA